jgi:gamma-glutamyltranspeptidase/glutathione hydrolase
MRGTFLRQSRDDESMSGDAGMVAAGHPLTAEAGARVLREGGNAVDAAIAAMFVSWVAEPLLTGPGAGGYLLHAAPPEEPTLLDFFVSAPGNGLPADATPAPMLPVEVDFGDAVQVFNVGPSSCGTWGVPAGLEAAHRRWGTVPLADLAAPAAAHARAGVPLGVEQAYVAQILAPILVSTPEARALFAPEGHLLGAGGVFRSAELGDTIERLGADGAAPFYTGDVGTAILEWLTERGGSVTAQDLAAYEAVPRRPVRASYRVRDVLTCPPPNAGGVLVALALGLLDRVPSPPPVTALVDAMERAQDARDDDFLDGLDAPGFADRFLASRLGATTHISVLDSGGRACSVTTTNGEGSGVVVPGTGVHVNNIMGEDDLNPRGFHTYPAGRRLPSMMAPTVVVGPDGVELVLGSAGSNRIRSAVVQTIVGVVDHGRSAQEAIDAPRVHFEDGVVFAEPGIDVAALRDAGRSVTEFRARNLFFGGAQAVERDPGTGALSGGGDPRRGGAAVSA